MDGYKPYLFLVLYILLSGLRRGVRVSGQFRLVGEYLSILPTSSMALVFILFHPRRFEHCFWAIEDILNGPIWNYKRSSGCQSSSDRMQQLS